MGYHRAGFTDIVGVDNVHQPDYPFAFVQSDVFDPDIWKLGPFDAVHASPPCQDYTPMTNRYGVVGGGRYDRLIGQTLEWIEDHHGGPWVLENVDGAGVDMPGNRIRIHGGQFGLPVYRPRLFASNVLLMSPPPAPRPVDAVAVYGRPDGRRLFTRADGTELRAWKSIEAGQEALGVPWITDPVQVAEAIPPAYTEFVGEQIVEVIAYADE